MTPNHSHYYIARMTIEAVTPLSISTGAADGIFDVNLVRDANGLPALPGSSITGVLRHLYQSLYGAAETDILFGSQNGNEGVRSSLNIAWGVMQDSEGRAVIGQLTSDTKDTLVNEVIRTRDTPVLRDRVRITHRGTAADSGKFDRSVVPAGFRFSTEITLWSETADDSRLQKVLYLLNSPLFRVGGGTRAGLGRIKLVHLHTGHFNLGDADGRRRFTSLQRGLSDTSQLSDPNLDDAAHSSGEGVVTANLTLKPRGFWRIGQGELSASGNVDKPADLLPRLEQRICWSAEGTCKGRITSAELLIPASSIKGALAHRVAFHANRFAGRWVKDEGIPHDYDISEHCDEVQDLFGFARDDKATQEGEQAGKAGSVFIDDAYLDFTAKDIKEMMHNAIDRFTGGVREHMLFSEELVWKKSVGINMTIKTDSISCEARKALRHALDDLRRGRLAIGAGSGKGHGFCDAEINWSDDGSWIESPDIKEEVA